jgi:N-acetylmuramoyl-L-alanine amidase
MSLIIDHKTYHSKACDSRQRFLVLHYTAGNFAVSLQELLNTVSAHYLVPMPSALDPSYHSAEIVVYALVDESARAWHAGVSAWQGRTDLNDTSIGIEIVNLATDSQFMPFPPEQIEVVIALCRDILNRYPSIQPTHVVGHCDIACGRKMDPGPLYPWQQLYKAGIGAWFEVDTVQKYQRQFASSLPTEPDVMAKLTGYGYDASAGVHAVLRAFQMHFRPSLYDGKLDVETAAIAYALYEKYCAS